MNTNTGIPIKFYRVTDFEQEELAADLVSSFMIPELHRIYHNSRIDAAGVRFTKASEQVVEAIFCSHPVTKKIIEDLEPVVDEHLVRGQAAVDGGVDALDQIIARAVSVALEPFAARLEGREETSEETTFTSTTTSDQTKSTTLESSSDDKTQNSSELLKKKSSSDLQFDFDFSKPAPLMFEFGSSKHTFSGEMEGEGKDEGQEAEDEGEEGDEEGEAEEGAEESQITVADSKALDDGEEEDQAEDSIVTKPPLTFMVSDDVVRSLAAKSVQVEYDTELGQQVRVKFKY